MVPSMAGQRDGYRISTLVARTELKRAVRGILSSRTKIAMLGFSVLIFSGPMILVGVFLAKAAGEAVAAGSVGPVSGLPIADILAGTSGLIFVFLLFMSTARTATTVADIDEPVCLLLSTTVPNVVVGLIGSEWLLFSLWLLPPTVVLSSAFAYGAGAVFPVLFAVFALELVILTAVAVGFVLGTAIRHIVTVYEPIARYRTVILALLGLVYFGAIAAGWFSTAIGAQFDLLRKSPLGWPGYLLLIGVPNLSSSLPAAIGSLVGGLLLTAGGAAVGIQVATLHWFADPVQFEDETVESDSMSRMDAVLGQWVTQPVWTVAVTAIRRTKRAPIRLLYAAYPLFSSVYAIEEVVSTGAVPPMIAVLLCGYAVWIAGVLFTLNPLGDVGLALPAVLTSTISGREVVTGRILAALVVAVPLALCVSLAAGIVSPLGAEQTMILVAGTVCGAVATPLLAIGVGSLFPRFGSVRVLKNRSA
jgi:hypothetical protein